MRSLLAVPVLAVALLASCSSGGPSAASDPVVDGSAAAPRDGDQQFPDVLVAELSGSGSAFSLDVTISSPYDTPQRYADGWRVLAPDGTVLGEHTLGHDHASEQPFTRTQTGLTIPEDVDTVTVEGRDRANGFGGDTVEVVVTRS